MNVTYDLREQLAINSASAVLVFLKKFADKVREIKEREEDASPFQVRIVPDLFLFCLFLFLKIQRRNKVFPRFSDLVMKLVYNL